MEEKKEEPVGARFWIMQRVTYTDADGRKHPGCFVTDTWVDEETGEDFYEVAIPSPVYGDSFCTYEAVGESEGRLEEPEIDAEDSIW